jgi:hypothetical protein
VEDVMLKAVVIGIAAGAAMAPALAQELLVTGRVESILLQPNGARDCPMIEPVSTTTNEQGVTRLTISNMGGCQIAEVKVEQVLAGTAGGATLKFASRTGEWGRLNFPDSHELILVAVDHGRPVWFATSMRDGKLYFKPTRPGQSIAGVPLASLQGEGDEIGLDALIARIRPSR